MVSAPERPLVQTESRAPRARPRLHLDFLDGLRALAALAVVVDHAYLVVWSDRPQTGAVRLLGSTFLLGHFAVAVFIVLSGFCLMLPVVRNGGALKGGAREFFRRRARRILPPYYLSMAACLVLIATVIGARTGSHWDSSIHVDARGLFTHLALIHNLDPHSLYQIDSVLWSVAVECQIYLAFPLLVLLWRAWGPERATAAAFSVSMLLFLAVHHSSFWCLTPGFLGLFALGALAAGVAFGTHSRHEWLRDRAPATAIACALLLVTTAIVCRMGWERAQHHCVLLDPLVALATAALLVGASRGDGGVMRRVLSARPMVFLGGFSYSIYLMHVPLQQVVWQYLLRPFGWPPVATFTALLLGGTPVVIALSYLFYRFCERPFLNTPTASS